jgi:hypothetical protein
MVFESHDRFEAEIRKIVGDNLDSFIRELAHGVAQGWVVNRSLKKLSADGVDVSYTLYSKTLSNLKSLQDFLVASSYFKSIITSLRAAGWEVTTEVGQQNDEFFVYDLETSLVSDIHLEQ